MLDFNTPEKKLELIKAKYELSKYPSKKLMEMYNTEELYYELLFQFETILTLDPDFVLLGSHMEKYRRTIHSGRFHYKTHGPIREYEDIVLSVLDIKELTKEEAREEYLLEQLKTRLQLGRRDRERLFNEKGFYGIEHSICVFSQFDYTYLNILDQLKEGKTITSEESPLQYLSSMSYLINNAEEIFVQDKGYCNASLDIIDTLDENKLIPDDYHVGKIKRKLNRMNKRRCE